MSQNRTVKAEIRHIYKKGFLGKDFALVRVEAWLWGMRGFTHTCHIHDTEGFARGACQAFIWGVEKYDENGLEFSVEDTHHEQGSDKDEDADPPVDEAH